MSPQTSAQETHVALVVFTGDADIKWLRILKSGFRHCFLAIKTHGRWIVYNPLSHQTNISMHDDLSVCEMTTWLSDLGYKVVPCTISSAPKHPAPWRLYTCVEAVKRVLGIQNGWIFTPWQLYRHLQTP